MVSRKNCLSFDVQTLRRWYGGSKSSCLFRARSKSQVMSCVVGRRFTIHLLLGCSHLVAGPPAINEEAVDTGLLNAPTLRCAGLHQFYTRLSACPCASQRSERDNPVEFGDYTSVRSPLGTPQCRIYDTVRES